MKHAILILAHNEYTHLFRLVQYFRYDCAIFIHLDKDFAITSKQISKLKTLSNVISVNQKYHVHWGDYSILKAENYLLKKAFIYGQISYYHILSGQDYPIKPLNHFLHFFEENYPMNFFSSKLMTYEEVYFRLMFYAPYNIFDGKSSFGSHCIKKIIEFQKKIKLFRNTASLPKDIYVGSQWLSITNDAVNQILTYTKSKKKFLRRLHYTFAPEEIYFQTLLRMFLPNNKICDNNYRYLCWDSIKGFSPVVLDSSNYISVAASQSLFARKFSDIKSEKILNLIDKFLLEKNQNINDSNALIYDKDIAELISYFCRIQKTETIIDVKCGQGLYVSAFIGKGIQSNGIDCNVTKNEELKFLGIDSLCMDADINQEITIDHESKYDVAFCSDFNKLFCHNNKKNQIIKNLIALSKQYVIFVQNNIYSFDSSTNLSDIIILFNKYSSNTIHYSQSTTNLLNCWIHEKGKDYSFFVFENIKIN
jgi:hypothetical protein